MSDKARATVKTAEVCFVISAALDINGLDEIVTIHVRDVELGMPENADKSLKVRVKDMADEITIAVLGQAILNAKANAQKLVDEMKGLKTQDQG